MTAYNAYNGIPCTISPVLRNVLQKEWGFDGIIITDGGAFQQLKNTHKTFDNLEDAAQACIKAGTTRFLAANKSAVLLKNADRLLPLDKKAVKRIAVIGNRADVVLEDWYCGTPPYKVTPLDGLKEVAGREGFEIRYVKDNKRSAAEDAAAWADVVVVCLGNEPTCSPEWGKSPWGQGVIASEGREDVDRTSLQLEQEDLVKSVYKSNPNTVLVLISSFPYAINWSQQHVPSIVHFTQSCQELGHAVADVLFGDYNPAGRTTQTWVKSIDDLPHMFDYDIRNGRTYMYFEGEPLYAFGHGLSYTQFAYSGLKVSQKTLSAGEVLDVRFDVRNTGSRDGEEVSQVYVKLPGDKALKRLKGFARTSVGKGQTQTVHIQIPANDLMLWNLQNHRFELPAGTMELMVGGASDRIALKQKVSLR